MTSLDLSSQLDRRHVLRVRALLAVPFGEGDALPLVEVIEFGVLHRGHVKEQIFPTAVINETKTLVGQSLDCAFCHRVTLLLLRLESSPRTFPAAIQAAGSSTWRTSPCVSFCGASA